MHNHLFQTYKTNFVKRQVFKAYIKLARKREARRKEMERARLEAERKEQRKMLLIAKLTDIQNMRTMRRHPLFFGHLDVWGPTHYQRPNQMCC